MMEKGPKSKATKKNPWASCNERSQKRSPAPPPKKKLHTRFKKIFHKELSEDNTVPSEFIFSSSGNLELWGQPLGLLSCKKNCLVNLQGPSKCFILLFLLVVWNPWAHKAMTMSDFGDEEVCTLHIAFMFFYK